MIKIYLDQNHFSNIARGLSGVSRFEDEVRTYEYMLDETKAGVLQVYYSQHHLQEATRVPEALERLKPVWHLDSKSAVSRAFKSYVRELIARMN